MMRRIAAVCAVLLVVATLAGLYPPQTPVRGAAMYFVGSGGDSSEVGAQACTTNNPNNGCTLREALNYVNDGIGGDVITFAAGVTTVTLTSAGVYLVKNATISGPLGGTVTIRRDPNAIDFAILYVNGLVRASVNNIAFTGGKPASGTGGGIYNGGALTLTNSSVSNNTVNYQYGTAGGGIYNAGELLLINSTISDNVVSGGEFGGGTGGGISSGGGYVTLINSTVSGNTASGPSMSTGHRFIGGGIYSSAGRINLINSTVSGNAAASGGSGVYYENPTRLNASNSIITGNTNSDISGDGIIGTNVNNLMGGEPKLAPLNHYGGPTQTWPPLPGSPAINAGDAATCADVSTVNNRDQRGTLRPQGNACDIGAVESILPLPTLATVPSVGTAGQPLTLVGTNLYQGSTLTVDGIGATVLDANESNTRLLVVLPPHPAGVVPFTLVNPTGGQYSGYFTYAIASAIASPRATVAAVPSTAMGVPTRGAIPIPPALPTPGAAPGRR